jgi:hypothetical protein
MKLTGKIVDIDNNPMMGVNIYPLKDDKFYGVGTSSDYDGNFLLESDDIQPDQFIKFSYMGYKPIEYNAGKLVENPKTFKMMEDITSLGEVVVTASKPKSLSSKRSRIFGIALMSAGLLTTAIIIFKNK